MLKYLDRPHPTPPTNVETDNSYTGIDRGLFLTRDPEPKYLRVVNAIWVTYGPSTSPGLLKFKIAKYESKPETPEDYNQFTFLTTSTGSEWFEVATSGPIHTPILAEYWAKFIYYNYYILKPNHTSVENNKEVMGGMRDIGKGFTNALSPSIESIKNTVIYSVGYGESLSMSSFVSRVVFKDETTEYIDITDKAKVAGKRFDPVIEISKRE